MISQRVTTSIIELIECTVSNTEQKEKLKEEIEFIRLRYIDNEAFEKQFRERIEKVKFALPRGISIEQYFNENHPDISFSNVYSVFSTKYVNLSILYILEKLVKDNK